MRQSRDLYIYVVHQVLTNCYSYRKFLSQPTCAWARWQYFERVFIALLLGCRKRRAGFTRAVRHLGGFTRAVRHPDQPKSRVFFSGGACSPESSPRERTNPCPTRGTGGSPREAPSPPGEQQGPRQSGSAARVVLGAYEAGPAALTASSLGVRLAGEEAAVGPGDTSWHLIAAYAWVVLVSFSFESQDLEAGTRAFVKWKPSPLV